MPKVSVITPSYNHGAYISECIESVLRQTHDDIEYIVVDDSSKDNTADVVRSYADRGVRFIQHKENTGLHKVRHTGARASTGDYIMFIDSDDYLLVDDFIEIHLGVFDVFDDIDIVYCDYIDYRNGEPVEYVTRMDWSYIYRCCAAAPWSMFKRKCFDRFEHTFNFPKEIKGEDWDFWVSLAADGSKAYHINNFMVYRRLHENNSTNNYRDIIHIPYIISRHPDAYSVEEVNSATEFIHQQRPQYFGQEWTNPVKGKDI